LALACVISLTSSAEAQLGYGLDDFLGTWYGENETVPAGQRRVVPARLEVTEIPTLRAPRRFRAQLWIRCMDRPREVCDLGAAEVTAIAGNDYQLPVRIVSRHGSALEFCRFNMTLTSGTFDDGVTYTRFRKNGLRYSISPGRANCRPSEFTGIDRSGGFVNRTAPLPMLELPPGAEPFPVPREPIPLPRR